jgi:aminopeptidase N
VNLDVVSTPRMANVNRLLPQRVGEMLRVYSDLIGEAPYPNFTLSAVDDNLPGGHSPAFFALWLQPLSSSPYSWLSDPLSFDYKYPQFFLAHEVAHQWWGQAVGWKNYREQWLSEGFAQYFAVLFAGKDRGGAMMDELLIQMRTSAEDYSARGPIALGYRLGHVQGDSRIFRAVLYNKSAVVLHMLRRLVGDEAFFGGIRRYYRDWRYTKAGTDDLRVAFEAEAPMKLSRFFDRWVRQSGMPKLRVTSRIDAASNTALIRIEQIGDVFDLPFTVTLQYADGRTEAVTIPVTEAITERPIALKGPVKRIVTRDELTLAEYVK